jgi:hypothetical protein
VQLGEWSRVVLRSYSLGNPKREWPARRSVVNLGFLVIQPSSGVAAMGLQNNEAPRVGPAILICKIGHVGFRKGDLQLRGSGGQEGKRFA